MPEGHTITRIARTQNKLLGGRQVAVSSPQGRFGVSAALVDGQTLTCVESYGKHLFYWWANGMVGHVHLGLFGKFRVHLGAIPPEPVGMVRMRMSSDVATIDLAGPTACAIGTRDERDAIVARLGPDPLRRDARPSVAIERMSNSKQAIGALLLDQSVLSGVGNVFRAEALFVHGINPTRPGRACDRSELEALWETIRSMLRRGVKDNRIITIDRTQFDLPRGRLRRGEATHVYHRAHCLRCGTTIRTVDLGGRPCYYCPQCQPT